jgi:hypothetical protein
MLPAKRELLGTTSRYPFEVRDSKYCLHDIPDVKVAPETLKLAEHVLSGNEASFACHCHKPTSRQELRLYLLNAQLARRKSDSEPWGAGRYSSITERRYWPYALLPNRRIIVSSRASSMNPRSKAISSGQQILNPWRISSVRAKLAASTSESGVAVSSHAKPRPMRSTLSAPASRYTRLTPVISCSPRAEGLSDLAMSTTFES